MKKRWEGKREEGVGRSCVREGKGEEGRGKGEGEDLEHVKFLENLKQKRSVDPNIPF